MDLDLPGLAAAAGAVGGMLSVGAFLPQAWRIVQRRSAADVSLAMYLAVIVASFLWIFYGWVHGSTALVATNGVIAAIAVVIVALKLRYGREK